VLGPYLPDKHDTQAFVDDPVATSDDPEAQEVHDDDPDSRRLPGGQPVAGGSLQPHPSLAQKQQPAVSSDGGLEGMILVRGIPGPGGQAQPEGIGYIQQPSRTVRHRDRSGAPARINFRSVFGPPAHTGGGTLVPSKVKEGLRRRRELAMLMVHGPAPFKRAPQPPRPETPGGIKLDGQWVCMCPFSGFITLPMLAKGMKPVNSWYKTCLRMITIFIFYYV